MAASTAEAAEEPLDWSAPSGCADLDQVMAIAAELTGQAAPLATGQGIRGVVERTRSGWQLSLTLQSGDREGSRQITAPSCDELARAAAVAVALALDPGGAAEAAAPEAAASASATPERAAAGTSFEQPAVEASPAHDAALDASPEAARELGWRLQADALLDGVALGSLAPGGGLSLGVRRAALSVYIYGSVLATQRQAVDSRGSVELGLASSGARGCYEVARGWLVADACAGVDVGRVTARGRGLENAASYADWWIAPSLGVALESELGSSLYLRASADALVPAFRQAYRVNDGALVHRAPSVGLRAALSFGVRFGGG